MSQIIIKIVLSMRRRLDQMYEFIVIKATTSSIYLFGFRSNK